MRCNETPMEKTPSICVHVQIIKALPCFWITPNMRQSHTLMQSTHRGFDCNLTQCHYLQFRKPCFLTNVKGIINCRVSAVFFVDSDFLKFMILHLTMTTTTTTKMTTCLPTSVGDRRRVRSTRSWPRSGRPSYSYPDPRGCTPQISPQVRIQRNSRTPEISFQVSSLLINTRPNGPSVTTYNNTFSNM